MFAIGNAFVHATSDRLRCNRPSRWYAACVPVAIGLTLLGGITQAATHERWPEVAFPETVKPFAIGEKLTVNGLPMRVQGFVSNAHAGELAAEFKQSLGGPLVENTIGNKRILGRANGGYYMTIQIEPVGQGSKGVVAITDLKGMNDNHAGWKDMDDRWLNRLPSGSKIVSRMTSEDAGKTAAHLVIANGHSERLNRDALTSMMREDGFQLEREATPDDKTAVGMPAHLANGKVLFFKGAGKEATAAIVRDAQGRTSVVLNTVTVIEELK